MTIEPHGLAELSYDRDSASWIVRCHCGWFNNSCYNEAEADDLLIDHEREMAAA